MSLLPSRPDVSTDDSEPRVIGVESDDAEDVIAALSSETARSLLAELHEEPAPPGELADRVDTSVQNVQYHLDKLVDAGAVEVADTAYSAKGREMDVYAPADQPLVIFAGDNNDQSTLRTALSRLLGAVGVLGAASLVVQALASEGGLFGAAGDAGEPTAQPTTDAGDGASGGDDTDADVTADAADTETAGTETPSGEVGVASDETPAVTTEDTPAPEGTPDPSATATPEPSPNETPMPDATPDAIPTPTPDPQTAVDTAAGLPPGVLFFAGGLFVLAVVVLFSRR